MSTHPLAAATVLAFALGTSTTAATASPVEVSFSIAGSPGAWVVDFTFRNNLSTATGLYFLGVKSDGLVSAVPAPFVPAFAPTFNTQAAGGLDITYNKLWLDGPGTALTPGSSMSGFKVSVPTLQAPTTFDWFAMTRGASVTDPFQFGTPSTAGYQGLVTSVPEPQGFALFVIGISMLILRNRQLGKSSAPSVA